MTNTSGAQFFKWLASYDLPLALIAQKNIYPSHSWENAMLTMYYILSHYPAIAADIRKIFPGYNGNDNSLAVIIFQMARSLSGRAPATATGLKSHFDVATIAPRRRPNGPMRTALKAIRLPMAIYRPTFDTVPAHLAILTPVFRKMVYWIYKNRGIDPTAVMPTFKKKVSPTTLIDPAQIKKATTPALLAIVGALLFL